VVDTEGSVHGAGYGCGRWGEKKGVPGVDLSQLRVYEIDCCVTEGSRRPRLHRSDSGEVR
jgi:hypothetical protein